MAANAGRVILKGKMKVKGVPSASSQLGKYLGIPEPPRADTSKLISTFIKINNRQVFRPQSSTRPRYEEGRSLHGEGEGLIGWQRQSWNPGDC